MSGPSKHDVGLWRKFTLVALAIVIATAMVTAWEQAALAAPGPEDGAGAAAVDGGASAEADPRHAHVRLRDARGELLFSTWAGEEGSLQHADPERHEPGVVEWKGPDGLVGRRPLWEPVVGLFSMAPPNATVRLQNYTVPETKLDEVVVPRTLELASEGVLTWAEADEALGANLTPGATRYFLGLVPLTITHASEQGVGYRFDLDEPLTFDVTRSVGLQATATPLVDERKVLFAFDAPSGTFTAHNNCALASKYLEPGHYVVLEETKETLHLARYNNEVERIVGGARVDLEITFLDGAAEHVHDHSSH